MTKTAHSPFESAKRALGSWPTRVLRPAVLALAVVAVVAGPNQAHACAAVLETAYADYARVVAGRPLDADEIARARAEARSELEEAGPSLCAAEGALQEATRVIGNEADPMRAALALNRIREQVFATETAADREASLVLSLMDARDAMVAFDDESGVLLTRADTAAVVWMAELRAARTLPGAVPEPLIDRAVPLLRERFEAAPADIRPEMGDLDLIRLSISTRWPNADEAERAAILDYVDGIAPLPHWIVSDLTLETGLAVDRDRIMARISRLNRALGTAAVNQSMGGVLDAIGQW
ncbi:MAG: hypothetical protein AAF376_02020 [Pseudomonadota bacterium]